MRRSLRFGIVLSVTVLLGACSPRVEREAQERAVSELQQTLARSAPASVTAHHDGARLWKTIRKFYAERGYLPAWINGTRPTAQLDGLLHGIEEASRHGLDPELYDLTLLKQARSQVETRFLAFDGFEPEAVAPLDLRLTAAWFSYASDLSTGVTDRPHADAMWRIRPKQIDLLPVLAASLDENRVEEALDELAPQHSGYRHLMKALEVERTRTPGTKGTKGTQIISLNLERWRWYPRDLGARHIRVNVPEYHLEVREGARTALDMKVIVGAKDNPTPIFSDTMTTIVFSPYWNVPAGIASEETLPAVLSDPEFLSRNNIEVVGTSGELVEPESIDWAQWMETIAVEPDEAGDETDNAELPPTFPYRFRQRPGTSNSLGLVKFLFPNAFDVYLHDTPADALFKRPYRALSHGCVRLEQPVELAEYLLRDRADWNTAKIQKAMHAGDESHVQLAEPLPVHLMYWTAVADEDGGVKFFSDLYGYDARQWRVYQARIERVKQKKRALPAEGWIKDASKPAASSTSVRRRSDAASPRRAAPRGGTASR
jgi:murein L,D-transpeptidase YcbB/YkuD